MIRRVPAPSPQESPPQSQGEPASPPPPEAQGQPASPPAYNFDKQRVAEAQAVLNRLGYDAGTVDGLYGPRTRRAIQAFEMDRNLPRRGDLTDQLLASLAEEAPAAGVVVAEPQSRPPNVGAQDYMEKSASAP